jgi:hypothetical protein
MAGDLIRIHLRSNHQLRPGPQFKHRNGYI